MKNFEEFKNEIRRRAILHGACAEQYIRFWKKTDFAGLCEVIRNNFIWCCNNIFDKELFEVYGDILGQYAINYNKNVNSGCLMVDGRNSVKVGGNVTVYAKDETYIVSDSYSHIIARDNTIVHAYRYENIEASDNAEVDAYRGAYVIAFDDARLELSGGCMAKMYDNTTAIVNDLVVVVGLNDNHIITQKEFKGAIIYQDKNHKFYLHETNR